jgi:hypothetical protein
MNQNASFLVLGLFFPFWLSAQNTPKVSQNDLQMNTITTALPFMAITPDSRAGGMGDAGTALSGDANSIYWNTSMLNFAKQKSEISLSYTPWLRQLTNDMHLSYLSGYYRINERNAVGGSLRYFSLGEIAFTDASGNLLRNFKPNEFELTGGYAFRLSQRLSLGVNGKFAYSNLTGGLVTPGATSKAGIVGASDISFTYFNDDAKLGSVKGAYTFAATVNNIGNKVAYSELAKRDFVPMNLKIGNSFKAEFDKYNQLTFSLDLQKLLVPTPPIYIREGTKGVPENGTDPLNEYIMISGKNSNVGVILGMLQSFYDAPGAPVKDNLGNYVMASPTKSEVVKGSRLKEELTEVNLAFGLEYWYNNVLALRSGVFYENKNKGNRQYFNAGIGFKYNRLGIDVSYLASLNGRQSPLANTLRFTLRFTLGSQDSEKSGTDAKPE